MAENQKAITNNVKSNKGVKEWFRKKIVSLKRAPQTIPLAVLAITTIYFMFILFTLSMALNECYQEREYVPVAGLCLFVTTLLSLLVLVSFLNAFPKRKKPNIFFIVLVFVMIGAMVACDLIYYFEIQSYLLSGNIEQTSSIYHTIQAGQPYTIVHVILLGVSAVVFALLPAYRILINKINTKVELESATENMKGGIDIQED